MSIKVTVNSVGSNRVAINSNKQETVRTVGIGTKTTATSMSDLADVDTSDADTNETLVYDDALGKFVVKVLPVVNGGTF